MRRRHIHVLERSQRVELPVGRAFEFYADAHNLEKLTPPWMAFEVITPGPIEMRPGALIDYRIRLHGVGIRWRTRIEAWEPPLRFVDVQLRGPAKPDASLTEGPATSRARGGLRRPVRGSRRCAADRV